jgi:hypothetical protein
VIFKDFAFNFPRGLLYVSSAIQKFQPRYLPPGDILEERFARCCVNFNYMILAQGKLFRHYCIVEERGFFRIMLVLLFSTQSTSSLSLEGLQIRQLEQPDEILEPHRKEPLCQYASECFSMLSV